MPQSSELLHEIKSRQNVLICKAGLAVPSQEMNSQQIDEAMMSQFTSHIANIRQSTKICRQSTVPSELTTSTTAAKPTRAEARKIRRVNKQTAEVEKMKSDLKKPTAFQLNSKKDRKVMNNQVLLTQTTVAIKKRNSVSPH